MVIYKKSVWNITTIKKINIANGVLSGNTAVKYANVQFFWKVTWKDKGWNCVSHLNNISKYHW